MPEAIVICKTVHILKSQGIESKIHVCIITEILGGVINAYDRV